MLLNSMTCVMFIAKHKTDILLEQMTLFQLF